LDSEEQNVDGVSDAYAESAVRLFLLFKRLLLTQAKEEVWLEYYEPACAYDLTSVYFLCNTIYGCLHLKIGMPVKKQRSNVVGCQLKHI
jgi:hypothetical protein